MNDETQPAEEVKEAVEAEPTQEETGAPDIDELLKEFEEDKPAAEPKPETPDEMAEVVEFVKQQKQKMEQDAVFSALSASAKSVLENSDTVQAIYDNDDVEALLEKRCTTDDRWMNAFNNQSNKPEAWQKLLGEFRRELEGKVSAKLDNTEKVRTDKVRGAETSARGITDAPPEEKRETHKLPAGEFNVHFKERFGETGSF